MKYPKHLCVLSSIYLIKNVGGIEKAGGHMYSREPSHAKKGTKLKRGT